MIGMRARFVNEKYTEHSDPVKDMGIGLKDEEKWANEMISALENYTFTEFGGSLHATDVKIDYISEGSADVTGVLKVGNVQFNLYFNIRDNRRWNDPTPKWESDVSISSPQKKGFFSKHATGKNTSPENLLKLLSNMFNLKYRR